MNEARRKGSRRGLISWAFYDWANSSFPTLIETFVFAAYFARQVAPNETAGATLWGYAIGISGMLVLGSPILGAIVDQSGRRKPWIAAFTILCVTATALLWFVTPSTANVLMALVLVSLGVIGMEYATIFYNAMLPSIAPPEKIGRWSGWGWGLGYAGGLACLTIALLAFIRAENPWFDLERESARHVRATFLLVAAWFCIFSLPLFLFTPDARAAKPLSQAARDGWRQVRDSFRQISRYRKIVRFLIARMIYVDGLATMFAFGGIFAVTAFEMTEEQVLMFAIALNISAGLGAAGFAWLDDRWGGKTIIIVSLLALIVLVTLILTARSVTAFWTLGILLGIFVGPAQAASRSYLARVVPAPLQNEAFGLFVFSGKATAFLGPLLVGWITHITGSQRLGMGIIVLFLVVGLWMMLTVPADKRA